MFSFIVNNALHNVSIAIVFQIKIQVHRNATFLSKKFKKIMAQLWKSQDIVGCKLTSEKTQGRGPEEGGMVSRGRKGMEG